MNQSCHGGLVQKGYSIYINQTDEVMRSLPCIRVLSVMLVLLIAPGSILLAQDSYGSFYHRLDSLESDFKLPSEPTHQHRIGGSIAAGAVFMSKPASLPFTTLYAAPGVSYQMTPRLALHGGLMAVSTGVSPYSNEWEVRETCTSGSLSMYLAASYRLNDFVMLHGSGTRHLYVPHTSSLMRSSTFDDFSLGASFTIGAITIGASVHSQTNPLLPGAGPAGFPMYPSFW